MAINTDILKVLSTLNEHGDIYATLVALADMRGTSLVAMLDELPANVIAQLCACNQEQIVIFNFHKHVIVPKETSLADLRNATLVTKEGSYYTADRASLVDHSSIVITNDSNKAHSIRLSGRTYGDSDYMVAESKTVAYLEEKLDVENN